MVNYTATEVPQWNGAKFWYQNGELHCNNGPATIYPDGSEEWYQRGKRHRDSAPAVFYSSDNLSYWYQHGVLHRDDGPAVTHIDGGGDWYLNGVLRSVLKYPLDIKFT